LNTFNQWTCSPILQGQKQLWN